MGPDQVDGHGCTRLMATSGAGQMDGVRRLLGEGAALDCQNRDGDTALILAIRGGHASIACLLIDAGADVGLANLDCESPLLLASGRDGSCRVVASLLEKGARIDVRNNTGETPLHLAAYHGHHEIVRLLLQTGADVNARDSQGETPLHKTAAYAWHDIAAELIAAGASRNMVNDRGETFDGKASLHRPSSAFPASFGPDVRQSAAAYREFIQHLSVQQPKVAPDQAPKMAPDQAPKVAPEKPDIDGSAAARADMKR